MATIPAEIIMQGNDTAWFTSNASTVYPANIQIFHIDGRYKFTDGVTTLGALPFLGSSSSISGLTTNYMPKATASDTIGNSQIFDDGNNVGIGTHYPNVKLHVNGDIFTAGGTMSGSIAFGAYLYWGNATNEITTYKSATGFDLKLQELGGGDVLLPNTSSKLNIANLTASQIVETDASKNLVSVAKQSGYNLPIGTTAGTVLEGNKVASTINFYNVKDYGAVGDGTTNDATAISDAITASLAATGNVNLIFPNGRYKVNSIITIDNSSAKVNIIGLNSELVSGITTVGSAILKISSASKIFINGLSINMNASAVVHYGMIVGDYANNKYVEVVRIENCDFYNFGVINQRGILVENTPFISGVVGNYNLPSVIISGCNFYNRYTGSPSINYTSNTLYGIAIQLGERVDYARIINCSFNFISIGVWSGAGANMDVTGCNFLGCLPKQTTVYTYGCIYVPNTGTNNGKVNVVGCKFNHNYGYSIYWAYATAERPLTVSSCHFIANATTAIYMTHTAAVQSRAMIHNNYFERCSRAFTVGYTNQPFGASLQPFIYMNNQVRASIKLNQFLNDGTYGVVSANNADYIVVKGNIWYNITGMSNLVGANNQVADNDNL